jgi:hypothetical protein
VVVVNQDHYINRIFHDPGRYILSVEEFDTPWVTVAAGILVDSADENDLPTAPAGYRHHVGANTWESRGGRAGPAGKRRAASRDDPAAQRSRARRMREPGAGSPHGDATGL